MQILILVAIWFLFFILTFRPPDAPKITRLFFFVLWVMLSGALGYTFAVKVMEYNPNPAKVAIANYLTEHKLIDLAGIAPGVYDLDYIHRVDTDSADEGKGADDEWGDKEWVVFYQYDVVGDSPENPKGPWGAAIYDYDRCRPPVIMSYELVPVNYEYLGEDWAAIQDVRNLIVYEDPQSRSEDRPEMVIAGNARGDTTDINIFRKVGVDPSCLDRQEWQRLRPGQPFPEAYRVRYENIGSFRGDYKVRIEDDAVIVWDRGGFERSQLTVKKVYRPQNGSYFQPGTSVLLDPVEYSVDFGPGIPAQVSGVYYPEKTVLAFYQNLGKDKDKLEEAQGYLQEDSQSIYDMETDPFGLSTDPESLARARQKLAGVLVLEIRYQPDVQAEQLHQDRDVTATVIGVNDKGEIDYAHPCQVTWTVVGEANTQALPYGCEWKLDSYTTTCPPGQK